MANYAQLPATSQSGLVLLSTGNGQGGSVWGTVTQAGIRIQVQVAPGATPPIDSDNWDIIQLDSIGAAITDLSDTGVPSSEQKLIIEFRDNGTAYAITWGSSYGASTVALPTTTLGNASIRLRVGFFYDIGTNLWTCVAVA